MVHFTFQNIQSKFIWFAYSSVKFPAGNVKLCNFINLYKIYNKIFNNFLGFTKKIQVSNKNKIN